MSSKNRAAPFVSRGGLESVSGRFAADDRSRCFWKALEAAKQMLIFIGVTVEAMLVPGGNMD